MKNKNAINYTLLNICIFVFICYLLYKLNLINIIFNTFIILFMSFTIFYIIYPLYKTLNKYISKTLSIIIIYTSLILFIVILIYSIIPSSNLIKETIELFTNILKFINKINIKYNININIDLYLENIVNYILKSSVDIIKNIVNYLSKFILSIILSICILLNDKYIKKLIYNNSYKDLILRINNALKNYLIANLKIIIIQFIEYTFILYIIGHPNYLLLGVLNSINSFIPYIGAFLTNTLAIITASVIDNKLLLLTSIISILLPNIDSYIITPKIYKNTNKLPQTLCISSIIIFGYLFKFYGVIFAIPFIIIAIEILEYKDIVKTK